MTRGGNRGGGTTPRTIDLSPAAARTLRRLAAPPAPARFTRAQASAAASELIEQVAALGPALGYLEQARAQCFSVEASGGLDALIAAVRAAQG